MKNLSSPKPISKLPPPGPAGFAKVVAGGRVVRPDDELPFLERMVTGAGPTQLEVKSREAAVLESVASNLEAGINIVDHQELGLAKIGGKLADVSLALNSCKAPKASNKVRERAQQDLEFAKACIRETSHSVYAGTPLFANGPSKAVTIAVPNRGEWEGISITRPDLDLPGIKTVLSGKVHGDSKDFFLDSPSIRRAFDEWRTHCIENRLLWGNLKDRLHGVFRKLTELDKGGAWTLPRFPTDPKLGPLRRPNRNN